mgnify:CR=1 FL=1
MGRPEAYPKSLQQQAVENLGFKPVLDPHRKWIVYFEDGHNNIVLPPEETSAPTDVLLLGYGVQIAVENDNAYVWTKESVVDKNTSRVCNLGLMIADEYNRLAALQREAVTTKQQHNSIVQPRKGQGKYKWARNGITYKKQVPRTTPPSQRTAPP